MTKRVTKAVNKLPQLVAHRGYAACYPENSLSACEAALALDCRHIEIDIQLTADGVPVLLHDLSLSRTAGKDIRITEIDSLSLGEFDIAERQRLGPDTPLTTLATLRDYVGLVQQWPLARTFVEIKEESLQYFENEFVVDRTLAALKPITNRCTIISYNTDILRYVSSLGICQTGWVLKRYDIKHYQTAVELDPDYLICNYLKIGDQHLWPGEWRWMLYEITDAKQALQLHQRGADLIETMAIGDILKDRRFSTDNEIANNE